MIYINCYEVFLAEETGGMFHLVKLAFEVIVYTTFKFLKYVVSIGTKKPF